MRLLRALVRERPGQFSFALLIVASLAFVVYLELTENLQGQRVQKYDPLEDGSDMLDEIKN